MAARSSFVVPLRQVARQVFPSYTRSRCLHLSAGPRRPPLQSPPRCLHQRRRGGTFAGNARTLFRQYPFSITLATLAILVGSGALIYANYLYQTYIIRAFHNFPEPVAKKLRRALYFTNSDVQPREAIKYYRQALQLADELGMDPFSDEIMGVKIQIAKLMEDTLQPAKAIQVLEILRRDSLEWIRQFGELEHNRVKRTRVLAKCVAISVKLGDLYGDPDVYDRETAEERLVWAVETALKERQRRDRAGATDAADGPWMSQDEMGAALERLAHAYEAKDQHYLAAPLFLQALTLAPPPPDCHSVVLMNNLASSLAQQSPRAARAAQAYAASGDPAARPVGPAPSREALIAHARSWAEKALSVAAHIAPPRRTAECDHGCAVATHNLGEFAEMAQDVAEARRRYEEAVSIARAVAFQEGVENSSARLRALKAGG